VKYFVIRLDAAEMLRMFWNCWISQCVQNATEFLTFRIRNRYLLFVFWTFWI